MHRCRCRCSRNSSQQTILQRRNMAREQLGAQSSKDIGFNPRWTTPPKNAIKQGVSPIFRQLRIILLVSFALSHYMCVYVYLCICIPWRFGIQIIWDVIRNICFLYYIPYPIISSPEYTLRLLILSAKVVNEEPKDEWHMASFEERMKHVETCWKMLKHKGMSKYLHI